MVIYIIELLLQTNEELNLSNKCNISPELVDYKYKVAHNGNANTVLE